MSRRRTRPIRIPNVTLDSRRRWWIRTIVDCSPANGSSGSSAYCIWWRGVMAARHLAVNERRRLRVSDSGAIRSRLVPALGLDDRIEHATRAGLSLPRNMIAPWWQRDTKPEPGRRPRREIPAAAVKGPGLAGRFGLTTSGIVRASSFPRMRSWSAPSNGCDPY